MRGDSGQARALWLAIIVVGAVISAIVGGTAVFMAGAVTSLAICAGGATFVSAASLGLAVHQFMTRV